MKNLKTFEQFNENDIYTLIEFIENKSEELEEASNEFSGNYFNYEIINDQELDVSYGWTSMEEHNRIEAKIKFEKDRITLIGKQDGFSVMSEDGSKYENHYNYTFYDVNEIIDFLNQEI